MSNTPFDRLDQTPLKYNISTTQNKCDKSSLRPKVCCNRPSQLSKVQNWARDTKPIMQRFWNNLPISGQFLNHKRPQSIRPSRWRQSAPYCLGYSPYRHDRGPGNQQNDTVVYAHLTRNQRLLWTDRSNIKECREDKKRCFLNHHAIRIPI